MLINQIEKCKNVGRDISYWNTNSCLPVYYANKSSMPSKLIKCYAISIYDNRAILFPSTALNSVYGFQTFFLSFDKKVIFTFHVNNNFSFVLQVPIKHDLILPESYFKIKNEKNVWYNAYSISFWNTIVIDITILLENWGSNSFLKKHQEKIFVTVLCSNRARFGVGWSFMFVENPLVESRDKTQEPITI